MVKGACHDIYETHCSMQSKKNPDVLDFSSTETFWKNVKENCVLSLP
jgi:hypothetical protein